jgi:hypothetical protein
MTRTWSPVSGSGSEDPTRDIHTAVCHGRHILSKEYGMKLNPLVPLMLMVSLPAMTACARTPEPTPAAPAAERQAAQPAAETVAAPARPASTAALPLMVVHKSPTCGCCTLWADHMRAAGFPVEVRNVDNLEPVKSRVGVPFGKGSCHTAEVGGYFVEGHVPAADVKRLLAEKPDAKGLAVPGMPLGSPGMEMPDGRVQPYTVELVRNNGMTEPFVQHGR